MELKQCSSHQCRILLQRIILLAILWSIWIESNRRIVRGASSSREDGGLEWRNIQLGISYHIVKLNDNLHNEEACMKCRSSKVRKVISWSFPSPHV